MSEEKAFSLDAAIRIITENIATIIYAQRNIEQASRQLAIDDNIFENLNKEEADSLILKLKEALVTISAIKANGLNRETVNYLLNKNGPIT